MALKETMDPKYNDHHAANFLPDAVFLDQKIGDTSSDALQVNKLITKASELHTLVVRNTFAWFLHTSIWIISGVGALIAALYLSIE